MPASGLFCAGDRVTGDAGTLYLCDHGVQTVERVCDMGCDIEPAGISDRCAPQTAGQIAATWLQRPQPARFMIGLGNDHLSADATQDGIYTLPPMDLHDVTLTEGWDSPNAGCGSFVNAEAGLADGSNIVPMFTFAVLSAAAEQASSVLQDMSFMQAYWQSVARFVGRLAEFAKPAVVNVEPGLFELAEKVSGGDPTTIPLGYVPSSCSGWLGNSFQALGHCWVHLLRTGAPKAVVGFPVSSATMAPITFMGKSGGEWADVAVLTPFSRDAGCYEAGAPDCLVAPPGSGDWNQAEMASHLAWAKSVSDGLDVPVLWRQLPLGVPSMTAGSPQHYQDDRVQYVFENAQLFAEVSALGGLGAVFGPGDVQQTYITTDQGQFRGSVMTYALSPTPLP